MQNFSTISPILLPLGKKHRDMGCEYYYNHVDRLVINQHLSSLEIINNCNILVVFIKVQCENVIDSNDFVYISPLWDNHDILGHLNHILREKLSK